MPRLTAVTEGTSFEYIFCYKVCHLNILEIFLLFWGSQGCFVFAKCNMKADAAALVCYAGLIF